MRRSPWLLLLWLAAAVGAGVLYYGWQVHADLIGIVERRTHVISAEESGKLSALLVEVGRRVSKGDSVALLDSSALQAERKQLESELEALEQVMEADRRRFALEHDVLSLSITERRADKVTRDARLRAGRAEAAALDKEIARLKRAEKAGLGHPEQLGELVVRRRALGELNESLARGLGSLPDAEAAVEGMRSQAESVVLSKGGDRLERVMEVRDRLVAVTEREKRTVVTAPADGYITEILTRPGDAVQAFAPILTLAETATAHVDVYISESKDLPVAEGATVEVVSRRPEGG